MPPHDGPVVNAIEVVTDFGAARKVKILINLLKEYMLECGFLLEHNEAFEKTLQKLKEEYIAAVDGSEKKPLVIPYQGPNLANKTLVI